MWSSSGRRGRAGRRGNRCSGLPLGNPEPHSPKNSPVNSPPLQPEAPLSHSPPGCTVGGGSGFIISPDGLIVTNRHVVDDTTATYTVVLADGSKHDAKVLARDTAIDLALIKIDGKNLSTLTLGDAFLISAVDLSAFNKGSDSAPEWDEAAVTQAKTEIAAAQAEPLTSSEV